MTQAANDVLNAAMALSDQERAELVERLAGSIDPENDWVDEDWARAWGEEAERRSAEATLDPSVKVSWEEVRRSLVGDGDARKAR